MAATPETGFLVIADLTGYTAYLSGSEIEHAPAIAGDLLETIVGRLEPPFRLAKFEGDAAFLFVEDGRADGSLLLDAIEASYVAFRRRLRSIDQATSCDCSSCRLAPRLDLKFFVHHGPYVHSRIAGRDELAGTDVILVHRLLKGTVAAEARGNGFALFTAAAVNALGLEPDTLRPQLADETIEHLGPVDTFTLDLEARWQAETGLRRLEIADADVVLDVEATFAAEPSIVWAHLTSPHFGRDGRARLVIEEVSPGAGEARGPPRSASPAGWPRSRRSSIGSPTTTLPGDSPSRSRTRAATADLIRRSMAPGFGFAGPSSATRRLTLRR